MPKIIRYQPKTLKSCFFIQDIKNLITKTLVIKATSIPTTRINISIKEKDIENEEKLNLESKETDNVKKLMKKKKKKGKSKKR